MDTMNFFTEKHVDDGAAERTDQEIVTLAKEDPEMFGLIMERYEAALTRYLVRLTGWGQEEVGDILQEVFIKAYRYLNDYDHNLKFSSWIYRIAHNQAIDTLRHHTAHHTLTVLPFEDVARMIPADIDIEDDVSHRDDLNKIRKAIHALPLRYRDVLILRCLEEKNYEEIMDILKKPKGTIATLVKRGRELLFEKLYQDKA